MSFGSAANLSVGTLVAQFQLDASSATSSLASIITQTNNVKQAFSQRFIVNIDNSQAITNITRTTEAANGLKRALEFTGVVAGVALIGKAFDAIGQSAIGLNSKLQQSEVAMTALTGSAQTAQAMVQQLETLAAHSTFGLGQLQQAAQQMLAFGTAAQNVAPVLQAAQNAAAASGGDIAEHFQRISYVLSELNSGIPVSDRMLRQLAQAGVPLTQLAQALGVTTEQLYAAGKTGEITGNQLVTAFVKVYTQGNLGDFMAKQAQTFGGAMELIKTNVGLATAQAFQPLFQVISNLAVKLAEFVQTPTFQQWAAQVRAAVQGVIQIFQALASVLAPVGQALANFFGFDTSHIGAEMQAVQQMKVDVGQYDAALQSAGSSAKGNAAQLKDLKAQTDQASLGIAGLTGELAQNKTALDQNAAAIKAVKDQYDPVIQNANEQIRRINILSPDELQRKQRELELDQQRANLELSKPDTSGFDNAILSDQNKLANWPTLDTSSYDSMIKSLQAQIENVQNEDPAAQIRTQIQSIQDAMSSLDPTAATANITQAISDIQDAMRNLNTNELDQKINDLRDTLSQPAPDTTGLTNTLATLSAQIEMAAPGTDVNALRQQYAAVSAQKEQVLSTYQTQQEGGKKQLTLLEQQRRDQALANEEQRKADEGRIADLEKQKKGIEDSIAAERKADEERVRDLERQAQAVDKAHQEKLRQLQQELKTEEDGKKSIEDADRKAREAVQRDLKQQEDGRRQALAGYTQQMAAIEAEQARLRNLDAAAAAQRALDLAPFKQALDDAKAAEDAALEPLNKQKEQLDAIRTSLQEQKADLDAAKQAAEAQARSLKDAADNAAVLGQNLQNMLPGGPAAWYGPGTYNSTGGTGGLDENAPFIRFLHAIADAIEQLRDPMQQFADTLGRLADWIKNTGIPALKDFVDWLTPKLRDAFNGTQLAGQNFGTWLEEKFGQTVRDSAPLIQKEVDVLGDLKRICDLLAAPTLPGLVVVLDAFAVALAGARDTADKLGTVLGNLTDIAVKGLQAGLEALDAVLSGAFFSALGTVASKIVSDVHPAVDGFKTKVGELTTALGNFKDWVGSEWGQITSGLVKPFDDAWDGIAPFFDKLGQGINWLADHFHLPAIPAFNVASQALPGHAEGVFGANEGHWAVVGERGPEIQYIPKGSSIIPNHVAGPMGMLPGHADGFNLDFLDDAVKAVGGAVKGMGTKLVNALMDNIGVPDTSGVLPGMGQSLADQARKALLGWIAPADHAGRATSGRHGSGGDMTLDAFMAFMNGYGGPLDNADAYNDLVSVGREHGIDPRWFLAVMETESGFGTNAGRLSPVFNFIGMEVNDRGFSFDSGVSATDSGAHFAGYASLHDMLEDLAGWMDANGTNFASYDGSGVAKQQAYQDLLSAIPSGGTGNVGAISGEGWPDVLQAAIEMQDDSSVNGPQWNLWCEKFAEQAERAAGYTEGYWATALDHAESVAHNDGWGPPGSMQHWGSGYYPLGHAAINADGAGMVIGTSPQGIAMYDMSGAADNRGWIAPGLAKGGAFSLPTTVTVGDGGQREFVLPESDLRRIVRTESGGGPPITVTFAPGSIVAAPGTDTRVLANQIVDELSTRVVRRRRAAGFAG